MVSVHTIADIYQWEDGDGDGSMWLSDSIAEPYADLSGEVLWWAALNGASIYQSNLQEANLTYAQLVGVNFGSSNLYLVNLYGADLSSANLSFTNLSGADLSSTTVANANMLLADLTNADLSDMIGWDQAFWLAATYNNNTVLPSGMDPDFFGMEYVPEPPVVLLLGLGYFLVHQRRRSSLQCEQ